VDWDRLSLSILRIDGLDRDESPMDVDIGAFQCQDLGPNSQTWIDPRNQNRLNMLGCRRHQCQFLLLAQKSNLGERFMHFLDCPHWILSIELLLFATTIEERLECCQFTINPHAMTFLEPHLFVLLDQEWVNFTETLAPKRS
jgi:hypothetical protein